MRPALTTIGSLPAVPGTSPDVLERAVDLQRRHGIEILSDGEPRADMLSYYVGLPGIGEGPGVPRIVGRIRPLEDPSRFAKVQDLDRVRAMLPEARFKVTLTGPATFALSCASRGAGPAYRSPLDPALLDDLVDALVPIAREIARRGAFLQIDEPALSQGMREYGPALGRVELLGSEVPRERASLHVCGGLVRSKVLPALLGLEHISVLSLAFAGRSETENRALLDRRMWDERGMRLGAGCIGVQVSEAADVMEPSSVAALAEEIVGRVGPDRVAWVTPDCGLRATPAGLVPLLLENLRRGYERAFPR